jgi:adenylate cyclase
VNVLECKPIAPFSKYAAELLEQEESTFASSLEDVAGSSMIAPIQSHLEYGMVDLERMEVSQVLKVLEGTLGIIQSAVTDREFFERAVQMMVNMLELDQGWALTLNKQGEWKVVATVQNPQSTQPIQKEPKESLLRKLQESGQSVWMRLGDQSLTSSEVRIGLSESVGAPVLNPEGKVVGGLCGVKFVDDYYRNSTLFVSRKSRSQTQTEIRAIIMQILAGCVATGIAHLAIKRERDQLDTLLEQYFTRKVSERMKADPTLLRGSECEITSLFCDIRNFSWISAKLEPSVLIEWLQESLSCISECVPKHDGIVVDYIGDELLSIWGDISSESDNAVKAVRAGFAMIHAIDQLSEVWLDRFGGIGFSVGIGVNTGNAFVGNIGTPRKLKFGAIGSSINLASRVQGVTKYFQCPFLVTHQTWRQLNGQFPGRRIGLVSLVNIPEPVDLYQVFPESQTEMRAFCQEYEKALEHFERMEFREAVALAGQLLNRFRDDRPTIILMQRAISCIIDPAVFSKAIVISAK